MIRVSLPENIMQLSYNRALSLLSGREADKYFFAWGWTAPRFSGYEGFLHSRYFIKYGEEKYYARINRVRRWFGLSPYNRGRIC